MCKVTLTAVPNKVSTEFQLFYPHFKRLQQSPYWPILMSVLGDSDLLGHIVFCNDWLDIPPMKVFLSYCKADFSQLLGGGEALLPDNVKKAIGGAWGMVFKEALGYDRQRSVSVSTFFGVKTATYFMRSMGDGKEN